MKSNNSIRARFRLVVVGVATLLSVGMAKAAERIKVVASFSVIGDMVTNVAGDRVDLVTLVGPGGDTELFKPSMADGKSVAEAKIVFVNDLNDEFEPWLEPLLKQVKFSGAKIVVSRGVKTFTSTEERAPRNKSGEEEIDQHAWLDPKNAIIYVRNIAAALVKGDPANASDYRLRADAYIKEMQALDAWAKAEIAVSGESLRHYAAID
jgi:zinc/manganese transport system substrate-binding protein